MYPWNAAMPFLAHAMSEGSMPGGWTDNSQTDDNQTNNDTNGKPKFKNWKPETRIDLLLAKIAGHDVDISTMTPPVASSATEQFLLEIAEKIDGVQRIVPKVIIKAETEGTSGSPTSYKLERGNYNEVLSAINNLEYIGGVIYVKVKQEDQSGDPTKVLYGEVNTPILLFATNNNGNSIMISSKNPDITIYWLPSNEIVTKLPEDASVA